MVAARSSLLLVASIYTARGPRGRAGCCQHSPAQMLPPPIPGARSRGTGTGTGAAALQPGEGWCQGGGTARGVTVPCQELSPGMGTSPHRPGDI